MGILMSKKLAELKEAQAYIRKLRKLYLKYPDVLPEMTAAMVVKVSETIKQLKAEN
jgi:hypothetical protein